MEAKVSLRLKTSEVEEAQKFLLSLLEGLVSQGEVLDFEFEINSPGGPVTERCIISQGKVIG